MTTATRSEFARQKGWKPSYITKLIKEKRVIFADDQEKLIDVEQTEAKLLETRDPSKKGVADRHQQNRVEQGVTQYTRPDAPDLPAGFGDASGRAFDDGDHVDPVMFDFQLARARRETYLADMAEVELDKALGSVLERDSSESAFTTVMIELRQSLNNIKARLAPQFTTDVQKNFVLLDEAIDDALRQTVVRCEEQIARIIADQQ